MPARIRIAPYGTESVPAVRDFNRRLNGGAFPLAESAEPEWLPPVPGRRLYQEAFLALDGDGVRGGYLLKRQDFAIAGETVSIGYYHSAVSEGIVDPQYGMVGVQLLMDALRREPLMYALGMGSFDNPLPRMLKAAGWAISTVPFHFRIVRPARFLRQIQPLRSTRARRLAFDLAAFTGVGWAGWRAFEMVRRLERPSRKVRIEEAPAFGDWAGGVWQDSLPHYPFLAVRDRATLEILYPSDKRFLRFAVRRGETMLGWVVALDTPMRQDKYFGDLRLGSIVDFLAPPEHAAAVVASAAGALADRGVDLIVSNQGHGDWASAFHRAGFFQGPSNFLFASSRALTKRLSEAGCDESRLFLTRGDGDGPIHL